MARANSTNSKERRFPTIEEDMADRAAWDRRMQQRDREAALEKRFEKLQMEEARAQYAEVAVPGCEDPANDPLSPHRYDGWTYDRQRQFFAAIADGQTVRDACALVGMTVSSAYAFRRRDGGTAFALGWQTAGLFARDAIADQLHERAMEGVPERVFCRDGTSYTRRRYDNRLAMAMLGRLDRQADQLLGDGAGTATGSAPVQVIARHWDEFMAFLARSPDPAATAAFISDRATTGDAALQPALAAPEATSENANAGACETQIVPLRSQATVTRKKKVTRFPAWMTDKA